MFSVSTLIFLLGKNLRQSTLTAAGVGFFAGGPFKVFLQSTMCGKNNFFTAFITDQPSSSFFSFSLVLLLTYSLVSMSLLMKQRSLISTTLNGGGSEKEQFWFPRLNFLTWCVAQYKNYLTVAGGHVTVTMILYRTFSLFITLRILQKRNSICSTLLVHSCHQLHTQTQTQKNTATVE